MGARGDRHLYRLGQALVYGFLTITGLLGLAALVWAAIPQGAPVTYTATDVVTMPAGTTFSAQILNALGAFTVSSSFTATQNFTLSGVLTPGQITTATHNYNPAGLATATVLRLSTNASQTLTGLVGGTAGRLILVHNVGTQNLVLVAASALSTAANRFDFPGDLTLIPKAMVVLQYDGTDSVWRTSFPSLTAGPVSASFVDFTIQGTDPTPPGAGILREYAKSTGVHTRDSAGNIVGPLGTGGGGGSATFATVRVATTVNLAALSGTQTIDGVSVGAGGELVLVKDQTTGTQNGVYVASTGAWTRSTSFNLSAQFVPGFPVYVQGGTLNGGTVWNFSVIGAFTLGTTPVTFIRTGPGPVGEVLASKNANSGYLGLDSAGNATYDRLGSYAAHTPLAAGGTITPTALEMGIQGSGAAVNFTAGHAQIAAGTREGQLLVLIGTNDTFTVTLDNGDGVRLCGNTGSVVVGLNGAKPLFKWNATLTVWEQMGCPDLQQAFNVGNKVKTGSTCATGLISGDFASGNYCCDFWDAANGNQMTRQCFVGGAATDNIIQLSVGKQLIVKKDTGTPLLTVDNNAGTVTGPNFGRPVLLTSVSGAATQFANCCSSPGASCYAPLGGTGASTVNGDSVAPMPKAATIQNFYVKRLAPPPPGQNITYTIRKNQVNTALTCSIIQGASVGTGEVGTSTDLECFDTNVGHATAFAVRDTVDVIVICAGGTTDQGAFGLSADMN